MYSDKVLQDIAAIATDYRLKVASTVGKILALAEAYRSLGKQFTFEADADLDAETNRILMALSDEILADAEVRMRRAIEEANNEEDADEIVAFVLFDITAQNTLGVTGVMPVPPAFILKFILEGWATIGFANGLSKGSIATNLLVFLANPYISPLWKKAFEDGRSYASKIIREGGYYWDKGTPISPLRGFVLTSSGMVNRAYNRGVVYGYRRAGAIGYRVLRGSDYDCPSCDDVVAGSPYPIDDVVLPVHPNCVCYTVPVFEKDIT